MCLSIAVGSLVACAALTAGGEASLVAHYRFDEGKGHTLRDATKNGNHGTIRGASWVRCGDGFALRFDGTDDVVTFGDAPSLDLTRTVSVEAWIRPDAPPTHGEAGVVGKSYDSYVLTYYTDGRCWWYISGGGNSCKALMDAGTWHHVVGTFDGTVSRLYVDGVLADTAKPTTPTIGKGQPFLMGTSRGDPQFTQGAHYRGLLHDVRIYNRALAAKEVAVHHRSTRLTSEMTLRSYVSPFAGTMTLDVGVRGMGTLPADAVVVVALCKHGQDEPIQMQRVRASAVPGLTSVTFALAKSAPGEYELRATVTARDGAQIGKPATCVVKWPARPKCQDAPGAKVLNNLVTELLNIKERSLRAKADFEFVNPRKGWVFVASTARADKTNPVAIAIDGQQVQTHQAAGMLEAMRFLPKGAHKVSVTATGASKLDRLIVRAVPELIHAKFGAHPHVHEYGKYDWAFLEKHILPSLNVMVGSGGNDQKPYAERWKRQGRRWMVECGVPGLRQGESVTADQAEAYWSGNPGMADPLLDGVIADEFFGSNTEKYAAWTEAVRRMHANDKLKTKRFYPYCTTMYGAKASRAFIQTVMDAGYAFAYERYLQEQRTEAAARAHLDTRLRRSIAAWRKRMPGAERHMIVCVGTFSQPPESLDVNPATNHKVYLDMQLHLLASDPACFGLYGVMTYLSSYTDAETVRWMGKLFRHYCIEGKSERFCKDPYVLGHIENADFEDGLNGWTVAAAGPASVTTKTVQGFSWLQGRYPKTNQGDTVLWMKRSGQRPNRVSQTVKALEPGRLYSFRMYSGDFGDLAAKQTLGISVKLTNVEVLNERSFQHVFANCYSHHHGPFNREHHAWMNYHWIVFRPKAREATLEISDWSRDGKPAGSVGQELMMNFVQVQPYDAP